MQMPMQMQMQMQMQEPNAIQIRFTHLRAPYISGRVTSNTPVIVFCYNWCKGAIDVYLEKLKEIDFGSRNEQEKFSEASIEFRKYWERFGIQDYKECCYCFNYLFRCTTLEFNALECMLMRTTESFLQKFWEGCECTASECESLSKNIDDYMKMGYSDEFSGPLFSSLMQLSEELKKDKYILDRLQLNPNSTGSSRYVIL